MPDWLVDLVIKLGFIAWWVIACWGTARLLGLDVRLPHATETVEGGEGTRRARVLTHQERCVLMGLGLYVCILLASLGAALLPGTPRFPEASNTARIYFATTDRKAIGTTSLHIFTASERVESCAAGHLLLIAVQGAPGSNWYLQIDGGATKLRPMFSLTSSDISVFLHALTRERPEPDNPFLPKEEVYRYFSAKENRYAALGTEQRSAARGIFGLYLCTPRVLTATRDGYLATAMPGLNDFAQGPDSALAVPEREVPDPCEGANYFQFPDEVQNSACNGEWRTDGFVADAGVITQEEAGLGSGSVTYASVASPAGVAPYRSMSMTCMGLQRVSVLPTGSALLLRQEAAGARTNSETVHAGIVFGLATSTLLWVLRTAYREFVDADS